MKQARVRHGRRRPNGEGSVYQQTTGRRYWVVVFSVKGRREVRYFKDKEDARAYRSEREGQLARNPDAKVGRDVPMEDYLRGWLKVNAEQVRDTTHQRYAEVCDQYIIPNLGDIRLSRLSRQDVETMMVNMVHTPSLRGTMIRHSTADKARRVLRTALEPLVEDGTLTRNVAAYAKLKGGDAYQPTILTIGGREDFLAALGGHPMAALFTTLVTLGLRAGEALGLVWRDIDLKARTLTVRATLKYRLEVDGKGRRQRVPFRADPKTANAFRTLPLTDELVTTLRELKGRHKVVSLDGYVFSTSTGHPYLIRNVEREFHKLLDRAGLPKMRVQDLRHTCLSHLAHDGVAPAVAMAIAGHSNIKTTLGIYTHVMNDDVREALERRTHRRAV